jgi:hypothetical protein
MNVQAYWLSDKGKIIPVPHHHIDLIIDEPETFGLTLPAVKAVYKKHKEPLHLEGFARSDIMSGLIQKGWTRIRYSPRHDHFIIQPFRCDAKTMRFIRKWAAAVCDKIDTVSKLTGFKISATDGEVATGILKDLLSEGQTKRRRK